MLITTKKELKLGIVLSFLIVLVAYTLIIFNAEYVQLYFKDLKPLIGLSILFFIVFTIQLVMDINSFITIKIGERKKVQK